MFYKTHLVFLSVIFVYSDNAFVDTLTKCSVKDNECLKNVFQNVFKESSKTGIPEYDIPIFDPITLSNISLPLHNIAEVSLVEGKVKGLSGCVVNEFTANVDKGVSTLEITCDLTLKGSYKAYSDSPLIMSVLGGQSIQGDGKAKVKIDKLNIKLNFNFFVEERNSETYIKRKDGKIGYKYDVLGKVVIIATNLKMGDQDVSTEVTNLLNQHWRVGLRTVGEPLMERAMKFVRNFLQKFFDNVPTKYFIEEDLKPFVSH